MVKILFLDLETTGFPVHITFNTLHHPSKIAYYDGSRIVQLCAILYEGNGCDFVKIATHDYIVKPDKYIIYNSEIHGITQDTANTKGIPLITILHYIERMFDVADLLVAHNVQFDKNVLLSELYRIKYNTLINTIEKLPTYCTSVNTSHITRLHYSIKYKKYKQPKLVELHIWLFGFTPANLHNAKTDTEVLAKCYFELLKRGLIQFEFKTILSDI